MKTLTTNLIVIAFLAACGGGDDDGGMPATPDAGTNPSSDGAVTTGDPMCPSGTTRLVLTGAHAVDMANVSPVEVSGNVTGVAGTDGTDLVTFGLRQAFAAHLESLGEHDVAEKNLMFYQHPSGTDCAFAPLGVCKGFFAMAGTFTVLEVAPRYRATFTLSDLYERALTDSDPGAAIAGSITGCLDVPAP